MTFADDVLDDAWLSRTKRRLIQIDEGLALHLATLDGENDQWLVLSARWTATDACKLIDQEARLAGRLDAAWARKPLGLIRSAESLSLVYADDARRPLRSRFADTVSIGTFLSIACAAATALGHAHAAGLIHRVVTPTNLLIAADDSIRLTGFGSSVLLGDPAVLPVWRDHVLPYAAPESGRRSCAPDHRSDLYSLGVTLYELLTRRLPLAAGSSAEWRHAHAAIAAERPELVRSDVPAMLAEVLLKLLAKDPAERYQSSAALHADLAQCRAEWHAGGTIGRFELGRADAYVVGERNQALFGRDPQIAALARAIGRVTDTGRSELVLIAGAAGIGKSALVGALPPSQPPLRYSAQGKAEQLQSTAPYSPLAQALRTLTLQLISRDQDEVDRVRTALLAGLGGHGRLIVDLVPETELLIGAQPALGELPAPQALARIHTALAQSFAAFAQDGSPLLLFLDDLQWVDEASETFLRKLPSKLPANILLVIAHRDEADHQLTSSAPRASTVRTIASTSALVIDRSGRSPIADHRKRVALKPRHQPPGMSFVEIALAVLMPGPRRLFEGLACWRLVAGAGVPALPQRHPGLGAAQPRLCKAEIGIAAKGEQLLLAVEAVLHPPELRAIGSDEEVQALAVGELVILLPLGRVADFEFLERHLGVLRWGRGDYPRKYPQKQIDVLAFGGVQRGALT